MSTAAPNNPKVDLAGFISQVETADARHPRSRIVSSAQVTISTDYSSKLRQTFQLRISIHLSLIKQLRWMPGDRLDLLVNQRTQQLLVRRIPAGGWVLSDLNAKEKARTKLYAKFPHRGGMPSVRHTTPCPNVTVTDEGLLIEVPECASWERNARAAA